MKWIRLWVVQRTDGGDHFCLRLCQLPSKFLRDWEEFMLGWLDVEEGERRRPPALERGVEES